MTVPEQTTPVQGQNPPWVRQCDPADVTCANIMPGGSPPKEPVPTDPGHGADHFCDHMTGQAIIQRGDSDPTAAGFVPVDPIDLFDGEAESDDELEEAVAVLNLLAENDTEIHKLENSEDNLFDAIERALQNGAGAAAPHYILHPAGYWRWGPYSTVQRIGPPWTWGDLEPTSSRTPTENRRVVVIDTGGNGDPAADIGVSMDPWEEEPYPSNHFAPESVGHGTFAASIVKQYNPDLEVELFRGSWKNGLANEAAFLAAVLRARPQNAVVSISGGTYPCKDEYPPIGIALAIAMAERVVAASGNDGYDHIPQQLSPASEYAVDGVSAWRYDYTSDAWEEADWANRGEVYAPGEDVVGWFHDKTSGSLAVWSGTSFATPYHAARVASGH